MSEILYPLYDKAKKLLIKEYKDNFAAVRGSAFHELYMNEKIKHSLQVSGAGNGILAHEKYFSDKETAFLDIARTAILLHDIYRFREIRKLFETGEGVDHSVLGAELLSQTKDFNNILITLPVKHHGHMIEEMYNDAEYNKQDIQTKENIKNIAFAVRDADKIANWQFLSREFEKIKEVWLPHPHDRSPMEAQVNEQMWEYFVRYEVTPQRLRRTNADKMISVIAWLFDINYDYSIAFCRKLNLFEGLCATLRAINMDETKIFEIRQIINNYVFQKFHQVV